MTVGDIESVPHALPVGVAVWRVNLDQYPCAAEATVLSADERRRAARLLLDDDRRRFVAAHLALRHVLGHALDREPAALSFAAGAHGKPRLLEARGLEFNLSHSAHECLIGISDGRPIGVDVEIDQPVLDAAALARRHFTPGEYEQWERAAAGRRSGVFLQGWTRKEACLKALGVGLSAPPRSLEVGCDSDPRSVVAGSGPDRVEIRLISIGPAGTAYGAVALVVAGPAPARPVHDHR